MEKKNTNRYISSKTLQRWVWQWFLAAVDETADNTIFSADGLVGGTLPPKLLLQIYSWAACQHQIDPYPYSSPAPDWWMAKKCLTEKLFKSRFLWVSGAGCDDKECAWYLQQVDNNLPYIWLLNPHYYTSSMVRLHSPATGRLQILELKIIKLILTKKLEASLLARSEGWQQHFSTTGSHRSPARALCKGSSPTMPTEHSRSSYSRQGQVQQWPDLSKCASRAALLPQAAFPHLQLPRQPCCRCDVAVPPSDSGIKLFSKAACQSQITQSGLDGSQKHPTKFNKTLEQYSKRESVPRSKAWAASLLLK